MAKQSTQKEKPVEKSSYGIEVCRNCGARCILDGSCRRCGHIVKVDKPKPLAKTRKRKRAKKSNKIKS